MSAGKFIILLYSFTIVMSLALYGAYCCPNVQAAFLFLIPSLSSILMMAIADVERKN